MLRTASVRTFGCKVNQHESQLLEDALIEAGFGLVSSTDPADVVVINSCTVTHRGDSDARKAIRQALRRNPKTYVVLTGCYAQVAPQIAARQEGLDLILGNREKYDLTQYLPCDLLKEAAPRTYVGDVQQVAPLQLPAAPTSRQRARAFLKVQEGCHLRCAFCIVPVARGKERSVSPDEVVQAVRDYAAQGYPEVVLTGVHLGGYGRDHGTSLAGLIRTLDALDLVDIRVSSLEPMEVDADFLDAIATSHRVCPHFHLPLQAGSDPILRRMGRPYTLAQFDAICQQLKAWNPATCLGTDLIVGFPGESDEDFAATARYLAEGPLDYAHLFPYSPREGTRAAAMVDQVSPPQKAHRMQLLQGIDARKRTAFAARQHGAARRCVLEWPHSEVCTGLQGVADNYATCAIDPMLFPDRPAVARLALQWNGTQLIGMPVSA
ncbi:MAG: Threonylcarbamoyladenosine tRNA methylthiotransferase MtaB [bacterium]|nr:Threonylcarbamoyladenosine tRNA methylthiotransferase MtaB [bacterium]